MRLYEDTLVCPLSKIELVPFADGLYDKCLGGSSQVVHLPQLSRPLIVAIDSFSQRKWRGVVQVDRFSEGFPKTKACREAET